ncbi:MAG: N-acetylmuramoyl-L-alanine amidase [Candidatus Margulisiibacteriota bacterium]
MKADQRIFVFFLLSTLALFAGAEPIKISGVQVEHHKNYDRFMIGTSGEIAAKAKIFDQRLVLDFKGAAVEKPEKIAVNKSARVQSVRMGQFSNDPLIARVVFDLKRDINYDVASILGKNEVVVEISNNDTGKVYVESKPDKTIEPVKTEKKDIEVIVKEPKFKHKAASPEVVEVKKEKTEVKAKAKDKEKVKLTKKYPLRGKIIVVDPGHGGNDPGAMGPGGVWEKEINLKTARYLASYLRSYGAKVYMTRTTDVRHKLKEIVDFANSVNGDIYLGVHFNSMDNPKISGTETHYYTPQSYRLAEDVHKKLLSGIRREDRGIMRTMLYTVHHSTMPAILVEPVYMTHFQDGLLIKSKSFQKEVARDIALGVVDYFNGR